MGVVVGRYIDILAIIIFPYSTVLALFLAAVVHFLNVFFVLYKYS